MKELELLKKENINLREELTHQKMKNLFSIKIIFLQILGLNTINIFLLYI